MIPYAASWKENWIESKDYFSKWWKKDGLVIGGWYALPASFPKDNISKPSAPGQLSEHYLNADKSVQAVDIKLDEVKPLFNAVGKKGMYLIVKFEDQEQVEELSDLY
ncbi:MAG: hypothetical protein K9J16_03190 [Melioribacteraceae bacterium]|nr:hypothetical protein [Melioribacteraceae bacterium]MCF8353548.1 hypothetical protein [Melioribacteraceae bacterium]MCF8392518.1 hypothetical protein [Melioribacteraceae bacterium]MCF8418467.1 hypothetical protein [Melioribacteraceae bacterium]